MMQIMENGNRYTPTYVGTLAVVSTLKGPITVHPHVCRDIDDPESYTGAITGTPPRM